MVLISCCDKSRTDLPYSFCAYFSINAGSATPSSLRNLESFACRAEAASCVDQSAVAESIREIRGFGLGELATLERAQNILRPGFGFFDVARADTGVFAELVGDVVCCVYRVLKRLDDVIVRSRRRARAYGVGLARASLGGEVLEATLQA